MPSTFLHYFVFFFPTDNTIFVPNDYILTCGKIEILPYFMHGCTCNVLAEKT